MSEKIILDLNYGQFSILWSAFYELPYRCSFYDEKKEEIEKNGLSEYIKVFVDIKSCKKYSKLTPKGKELFKMIDEEIDKKIDFFIKNETFDEIFVILKTLENDDVSVGGSNREKHDEVIKKLGISDFIKSNFQDEYLIYYSINLFGKYFYKKMKRRKAEMMSSCNCCCSCNKKSKETWFEKIFNFFS